MSRRINRSIWLVPLSLVIASIAFVGVPLAQSGAMNVTGMTPATGMAGTAITIRGENFGDAQGTRVVTMNSTRRIHLMEVRRWSNTEIQAVVPNLPAGQYSVMLYYNSTYRLGSTWRRGVSNLFRLTCVGTDSRRVAYTATKLPTLRGNTRPYAINDAGQVVGYSYAASGHHHAFLFTPPATMIDLMPRGSSSSAHAINSLGQVAFNADHSAGAGDYTAYLYTPGRGSVDLGNVPGHKNSLAYGINRSGSVVGESVIVPPAERTAAFIYSGAMRVLGSSGTLGGYRAGARGINVNGIVVGWSQTPSVPSPADPRRGEWFIRPGHAFIYRGDRMQDLNSLIPATSGWELRQANAISNQGHVVGFGYHKPSEMIQAFLYINGRVANLGTFPCGGFSYALAVNDRGDAVGAAYLDATGAGNFRACIFKDGRAWNLNEMISPLPDWVLREATGINNRGQIICWAAYRDTRQEQAFLLTPVAP